MGSSLVAVEAAEVLRWQAFDQEILYKIYMPFVEGGGFFIATDKDYRLGDRVNFIATLLDEPETAVLAATVIWSAGHCGVQYQRGIGVQLADKMPTLSRKVDAYLAASIPANRPSFTL
jgi:type IV pilus assembly protein PilZ